MSFSALAGLLPKSAPAQLQLAAALAANGDQREALAAARKALQLDPASLDAMAAIGTAYLESKRYREALELAREAQKQYPQMGHALEADVAMAQQEYARAAAAYRKADAAQASGLLRRRAHEAESLASKGGLASDASLLEWVQRQPEDVDTRLYLGDVYAKAGNYKAAIGMYEAALKINPSDFRVINNIAWALQQTGDPRALDYAHQAFQLKPNDAIVADTLGWALVSQGKLYEGVQIMFKAVSLDPDNPEIRFRLAQALLRAGDSARARKELRALLGSGKKFDQAAEAQAILRSIAP